MKSSHIRNFVIIAHIDHGKSTLADRFLETTSTVESRRMRPQFLDRLDLERERGITIKMAPVKMEYSTKGESYVLNLIDTPGHSDFSYEVSRALAAVEGAVLLVDATQGIQAQTLSHFRVAQRMGLKILGAVNKVDLRPHNLEKVIQSLANLIGAEPEEIFKISGKTGEGIPGLLDAIVEKIPSPATRSEHNEEGAPRALIFDSFYDDHRGIVASLRMFGGALKSGDSVRLAATGVECKAKEIGFLIPEMKSTKILGAGDIGYLATGLKDPKFVRIGDTVTSALGKVEALAGYREPQPVVFISFYPDGRTKYEDLKESIERLHLNDAALSFEQESNEALGRGLRVGFLGELHFEITSDRLRREFNLEFLTSFPSVAYRVRHKGKEEIIRQAHDWPAKPDQVFQPMIKLEILTPPDYLSKVMQLTNQYELDIVEIKNLGESLLLLGRMPLAELVRNFDDQIKASSSGFASFSYELDGDAPAEVEKLEILIAGNIEPALTRIVAKKDLEREARQSVEKLKDLLPKEQFSVALQASASGKIVARETIAAMKKSLGDFGKNGGDRTRKMKLWKKQERGKERLKDRGRVELSVEVFRELLKK